MPYKDRHGNICGFLDVEEKEGSGHFVRRYFLLDPGRNVFDYYMDNPQNLPPESQAMGSFKIEYVSMVIDASKSRPKPPFCFYLILAGQKHFFCADDKADKDAWMKALLESARVDVPKSQSYSEGSMDSLDSACSYRAEVVGDVVIKIPLEHSNSSTAEIGAESDDEIDTNPRQLHSRQQALKTGYCIKQGGRRKNWLKRFFVLGMDGLTYFKNHEERSPIKTLLKSEIIIARESIGIHPRRDNVFEVVTQFRVYYIQADNAAERTSWVCEINRVLSASKQPKRQEIEELNREFVLSSQSQKDCQGSSKARSMQSAEVIGEEEEEEEEEVKVGVRLLPKYGSQSSS